MQATRRTADVRRWRELFRGYLPAPTMELCVSGPALQEERGSSAVPVVLDAFRPVLIENGTPVDFLSVKAGMKKHEADGAARRGADQRGRSIADRICLQSGRFVPKADYRIVVGRHGGVEHDSTGSGTGDERGEIGMAVNVIIKPEEEHDVDLDATVTQVFDDVCTDESKLRRVNPVIREVVDCTVDKMLATLDADDGRAAGLYGRKAPAAVMTCNVEHMLARENVFVSFDYGVISLVDARRRGTSAFVEESEVIEEIHSESLCSLRS